MPDDPPYDLELIASYHTHAAYSYDYDSEVPSDDDIEGDIYEGVNGYISTPGGRLWFVDSRARAVILLCGVSCVYADPNYEEDWELPVDNRYSLDDLRYRQE